MPGKHVHAERCLCDLTRARREKGLYDRLIASMLEVMRLFLHSPVLLVTRDINAQNKADYAGISFIEPPEPPP